MSISQRSKRDNQSHFHGLAESRSSHCDADSELPLNTLMDAKQKRRVTALFGVISRVWRIAASSGTVPARSLAVETAKHSLRKVAADPDIFFHCQHCKAALVANRSAGGMTLTCQKCGQLTTVPQPEETKANALAYADEIRGKLTENESQRAEITGNINQLTIQLHRWQLRLQALNERKQQLEKELSGNK